MEIAIPSGASVRTAYKTVRKRLRIEARRQKEVDGGVEPEVVLDSFLNQVKVEQHPQSGPLKRVLTPAAKAAKHRRARDRKLRETLCWSIANDKVCPDGVRCNFRHAVDEEKEQTVSGTGASWPCPATEQNDSGVLSPGPSLGQKNIHKVQRMTAGTIPGTGMTIVINGPMSGRVITMVTDGFMAGTSTTTTTTGRTLGDSVTLMTSGVRATGKRAAGVRATGRRAAGTRQTSAVLIVKDSSGRIILSSRQ